MKGYIFKRQRPIFNYIADFMCEELRLVVEVDGITHLNESVEIKDKVREARLLDAKIITLRFSSEDVLKRIGVVKGILEDWIERFEEENAS